MFRLLVQLGADMTFLCLYMLYIGLSGTEYGVQSRDSTIPGFHERVATRCQDPMVLNTMELVAYYKDTCIWRILENDHHIG